jgi:hypothetical protein
MKPQHDQESVLEFDRLALLDLWRESFGKPPPKYLS